MKKFTLFFLLLVCLIPGSLLAQTYHAFPLVNADWYVMLDCSHPVYGCAHFRKYHYFYSGDTVIQGESWKQLWVEEAFYYTPGGQTSSNAPIYYGALREDSTRKIWFHGSYTNGMAPKVQGTYLLYDFSAGVGDTVFRNSNGIPNVVTAIDSELVGATYRRKLIIDRPETLGQEEWIEGIGSVKGLMYPMDYEFEWNWDLECYQDMEVTYSSPWQSSPFPFACALLSNNAERVRAVTRPLLIPGAELRHYVISPGWEETYSLEIRNLSGALIRKENCLRGQWDWNAEGLRPGLYLLHFIGENGKETVCKAPVY